VDLFTAIRTVAEGGSYQSPTVSGALVDALVDLPREAPLSQRELQVLRLIVDGKDTKEVAAKLAISNKTVETYRKNLMAKLNITNLADLVKYALRQGITDLS
jgi:DNA-binding NarL/FixJ family response regulator